jgi:hypothetical protein
MAYAIRVRGPPYPSKLLTLGLGPPEASAHPFLNDRPLELGEESEHLKHSLAARRRGVDHHVELTPGRSLVRGVELRPFVFAFGARDAVVLIDPHDPPARALGDLAELTLWADVAVPMTMPRPRAS